MMPVENEKIYCVSYSTIADGDKGLVDRPRRVGALSNGRKNTRFQDRFWNGVRFAPPGRGERKPQPAGRWDIPVSGSAGHGFAHGEGRNFISA